MSERLSILRATVCLAMMTIVLSAVARMRMRRRSQLQSSLSRQRLSYLPHQQMARDILRELVEIDTTQAGNTTIAAEAVAARLLAEGFPEEDVMLSDRQRIAAI